MCCACFWESCEVKTQKTKLGGGFARCCTLQEFAFQTFRGIMRSSWKAVLFLKGPFVNTRDMLFVWIPQKSHTHSLLFDCFLPNLTAGYDVEDNGLLLFTLYLTGGKIELHIDILSLPLSHSLTHSSTLRVLASDHWQGQPKYFSTYIQAIYRQWSVCGSKALNRAITGKPLHVWGVLVGKKTERGR